MNLTLYHYWRSSSSWRVRMALAYKGVDCEFVHVGLLDGESEGPEHRKRNPMGFVPVLEIRRNDEAPFFLSESIAIMEWLEERFPERPSLLSGDAEKRAMTRQLSEIINSGTQPLQNLLALELLTEWYGADAGGKKKWSAHWIRNGLASYETLVSRTAGKFSVGDELGMADFCLIPQCYNAARNEIDVAEYPTIARIQKAVMETPVYRASEPERFRPADFQGP